MSGRRLKTKSYNFRVEFCKYLNIDSNRKYNISYITKLIYNKKIVDINLINLLKNNSNFSFKKFESFLKLNNSIFNNSFVNELISLYKKENISIILNFNNNGNKLCELIIN